MKSVTSRPVHAPADLVLPVRAQSADLVPELARFVRNASSSTWAAHDESPENTRTGAWENICH